MAESHHIRVLIRQEGANWTAQCLEYDIGAQADNVDELRIRLMVAIEAERRESVKRHGTPFAGIPAAPFRYYDMWERSVSNTQSAILQTDPDISVEFGLAA